MASIKVKLPPQLYYVRYSGASGRTTQWFEEAKDAISRCASLLSSDICVEAGCYRVPEIMTRAASDE